MNNHLLALKDFNQSQLLSLVERAITLKREASDGKKYERLKGNVFSMQFDKPSTRTRVSFEAAVYGLGGQVIHMSSKDSQLTRGEPLKDMARVMARYVDAIVVRTYGQHVVEELARYSDVPVINALTDLYHPCQILSDVMTVLETKGEFDNLKIVWLGDGNNMANSWIEAASVIGFPLTLACPQGYGPDEKVMEDSRKRSGRPIVLLDDPVEAIKDADVINVDVWALMGQEVSRKSGRKFFSRISSTVICLNMLKMMQLFFTVCLRTGMKKLLTMCLRAINALPLIRLRTKCTFTKQFLNILYIK